MLFLPQRPPTVNDINLAGCFGFPQASALPFYGTLQTASEADICDEINHKMSKQKQKPDTYS